MSVINIRSLIAALGFVFAAIATPLTSHAHEGHGKPQYGGIFGEAGKFQTELVAKAESLTVYLTDHGKAITAKGATGKLTLLADGQKTDVELKPSDDNKTLFAKGQFNVKKGTKAVATITLEGGKPATVRYEVK